MPFLVSSDCEAPVNYYERGEYFVSPTPVELSLFEGSEECRLKVTMGGSLFTYFTPCLPFLFSGIKRR
jgi:hypothetical protein